MIDSVKWLKNNPSVPFNSTLVNSGAVGGRWWRDFWPLLDKKWHCRDRFVALCPEAGRGAWVKSGVANPFEKITVQYWDEDIKAIMKQTFVDLE